MASVYRDLMEVQVWFKKIFGNLWKNPWQKTIYKVQL